ncbi:MAG: putative MFS family arabinose efflux permease [Acidimicrobiales bacterium]
MKDQVTGSGWQPLSQPNLSRPGSRASAPDEASPRGSASQSGGLPTVTPFVRLARTHAFHAAGEASVFVTLAGTLLSIDPNDARSRILLALVLTMAPFALVGPLIGPALDRVRGGRRATIALSLLLRAGLMVLLIRNIDTAWFFPTTFIWLVIGKTYSVAKAATVPTTVDNQDELVDKNSRLAILSAVAGVAGVVPAAALYRLFGATPTLWWAAVVYLVGVFFSMKMPRVFVDDPGTTEDDLDIRSAGVRLASFVMATLRGIVGFVFFLLLFEFVRSELPDLSGVGTAAGAAVKSALGFELLDDPGLPWYKAAIPFALWGFGGFAGNVIAPWFRRRFSEEKILVGAVAAVAVSAIAAIWAGGLSGAGLIALIVGGSASAAKLAFDSLVQRDAPGANHGAAFGRFETQFQIAWVVGSLLAVIVSFPLRAGFLVIVIASVGIGIFIMQQGARSSLSFGGAPRIGLGLGRRRRPRQSGDSGMAAPPAPPLPVPEPQPTTQMSVVTIDDLGPAQQVRGAPVPSSPDPGWPVSTPRDPYAEAFADQQVEPPDWAAAVFDKPPEPDRLLPPAWLNEADTTRPDTEPNPTPPMGTDRVE